MGWAPLSQEPGGGGVAEVERSKGKDHASGLGVTLSLAWRVPGAEQAYKTVLT